MYINVFCSLSIPREKGAVLSEPFPGPESVSFAFASQPQEAVIQDSLGKSLGFLSLSLSPHALVRVVCMHSKIPLLPLDSEEGMEKPRTKVQVPFEMEAKIVVGFSLLRRE